MFETRSLVSEKILEKLPTPCQFVGCSDEVMLNELENHEKECLFRLVECVAINCKTKMPLNEIMVHLNNHTFNTGREIKHARRAYSCCYGNFLIKKEEFDRETSWIPTYITLVETKSQT